jgi:hypothetical protein
MDHDVVRQRRVDRHAQQLRRAIAQLPQRLGGTALARDHDRHARRGAFPAPDLQGDARLHTRTERREQRRCGELPRRLRRRRHRRVARDGRRQHVNAPRADGHAQAELDREDALFGQRPRHLEQRARFLPTVAARRDRHGSVARHAHAQPFDGAAEEHFLHDAVPDEVRADLRLAGRELDLLRTQHRDHLARRAVATPMEAHAARRPVAEQQVRRAEKRRYETRGGRV